MDNRYRNNSRPVQPRPAGQPAQQSAASAASMPTPHSDARAKKPGSKKKLIIATVVALVVVLAAAAWFMFGRTSTASVIDNSKYQAVFFTNGQVYFGKLSAVNGEYMRLTNVYYLQNKAESSEDASPQSASSQDSSDVELIKLGNEIHGPEDEMLISKDQVLFFENLKPAGTVSQTITNFQKNK